MAEKLPEVWLRGPLPDLAAVLQPVAHALLQAREEVDAIMGDFPADRLWERPAGLASVGFHVQHLSGVLDRLFAYARGASLSEAQAKALALEGKEDPAIDVPDLILAFHRQVDRSLQQLRSTDANTLTHYRAVGRAQLPSTVLGLFVHSAEHVQRHVGQLLVTARIVRAL
jgi:hypothetical protein